MKYTGIAEASNRLVAILKQFMVPEVVKSPEQIGLCSPSGKGDCKVGVWLYDVRECEELRGHTMQTVDSQRQKYPSCYVNVFYMVTAYSNGDICYQAQEEQYILGKVIQVLKDHALMEGFSGEDGNGNPRCFIHMQNLSMEEKMRIFHMPDMGYKTSLFYEIGPIEIESEKARKVTRVVDVEFHVKETE